MIRICALAAPMDLAWLRDTVAELTMRRGWPDCELSGTSRPSEWESRLGAYGSVDIIVFDVGMDLSAKLFKLGRRKNPSALAIPLVTATIPPMVYVCPEILPFTLLWHPLSGPENREMLLRVLEHACESNAPAGDQFLSIKGKRESYQIPFREILFFEARDKKIYVHLAEQEIVVNDTLTALQERVPPQFLRCHNGFLVNGGMVESVDWSNQTLLLRSRQVIPISRSYRAKVKERINGTD